MFLKPVNRTSNEAVRGTFLIVASSDADPMGRNAYKPGGMRAFVRYVKLVQCGAWMSGRTLLSAEGTEHRIGLSGAFGNDGLTLTLPAAVWSQGVPVPDDVIEALASDNGHNDVGDAAPVVRAWALANLKDLQRAGRKVHVSKRQKAGPALPKTAPIRERWLDAYRRVRRGAHGRGCRPNMIAAALRKVGVKDPYPRGLDLDPCESRAVGLWRCRKGYAPGTEPAWIAQRIKEAADHIVAMRQYRRPCPLP